MQKTTSYSEKNKEKHLNQLLEFLKIPSVSADPAFKGDVRNAAEFLINHMKELDLDQVELFETDGHPIVYGEKIIDTSLPTILVYGHYDVQPADPIELWNSPPFEPVIKVTGKHPEGAIFARGACDDKGQMFMHLKAYEGMMNTNSLPCNVKFMFEGEEEVGSVNLGKFCIENKQKLKSDVILISDTSIIANDTPSINVGLRGLSYVEVAVTGPKIDLHSGVYGGAVGNPINILTRMISSMMDENNRITIPGFYDKVQELTEEDRKKLNDAPFNLEDYKRDLDIDAVHGEKGFTTLERTSIRPTLDVNGIWGGYIGDGAKTVLPSKAYAKISMRLVPNQTPDEITKLFTDHFKSIAPASVKVEVTPHHGGFPVVLPTDLLEYEAAKLAMIDTFGKEPIPERGGGSIPIVALFEDVLKVKTVLMGFGLNSDAIHSPNEHYGLFNFYKGIETIPYFFSHFTNLKSKGS